MRSSGAHLGLLLVGTLMACGGGIESDPAAGGGGGGGGGAGGQGAGSSVDEPLAGAGSRLVPRAIDGGDGAEVWFDFFDTALGVPCSFVETREGLRCVPKGLVSPLAGAAYLDAGCTEPAVEVTACNGERYAAVHEYDACAGSIVAEVFVGAEETVEASGSNAFGESCSETGEPRTLRPATRMDLTELVHGTLEVAEIAGDVGVQRLVGDDGAFAVVGLTRGGNACTPQEVDGGSRCVDDVLALTASFDGRLPLYADPACETEAALLPTGEGCPAPTPALAARAVLDERGCAIGREYHGVGDPAPTVYGDGSGTCVVSNFLDEVAFALGDVVAPSALPAIESTFVGNGRLRVAVRTADGAAIFGDATAFEDTELETSCSPAAVAGGGLRCIPGPPVGLAGATQLFSDVACDEPLYPTPSSNPAGCGEVPRFTAVSSEETCGALVAEVLERGDLHAGPAYWFDFSQGCMPAANAGNLYTIAARRPITDFAPLEVRAPE